jgi:DNA-binding MarR family transcriptional regulator
VNAPAEVKRLADCLDSHLVPRDANIVHVLFFSARRNYPAALVLLNIGNILMFELIHRGAFQMNLRTNSETQALNAMRGILDIATREGLSLELLNALIVIALEPGISVNELGERMNVPQQSASRYASTLLGRYAEVGDAISSKPKLPLVVQEVRAEDPRKRAMTLTARGSDVIEKIIAESSGKKAK